MRILHTTNAVGWSGGLAQLSFLIQELSRRGHQNILVCQEGSEILPTLKNFAVETHFLNMNRDYDVFAAARFSALARHLQPEIVHAHHPVAHAVALVGLLTYKKPALVVSRRVSFSVRANPFSKWKYRSKRIQLFTAVSQSVKTELAKGGVIPEKIEVVYSALNEEKFKITIEKTQLRQTLGIPQNAPLVSKVANYSKWKGHEVFLDAALKISEQHPQVHFLIAGKFTDQLRNNPQAQALRGKMHILGFRKDVPDLLAASDISINSAISGEGLSGAMRESLWLKKPVIASDCAGNCEIVTDKKTGLLFTAGNSQALAEKIIYTLTHLEECTQYAAAGRAWVEQNATLPLVATRMETVYQKALQLCADSQAS